MAIPFPRDLFAEVYLGALGWVDLAAAGKVRKDAITITRGRGDEQGDIAPTKMSLVLDNTGGVFTPKNPMSPYYGLLGRNTPMRAGITVVRDTFNRAVSNDWGTGTSGEPYTLLGTNTQFSVAGGKGIQAVTGVNTSITAYMGGRLMRDVYVRLPVQLGVSDVLGATLEPTIVLRLTGTTTYYMCRMNITAADIVQMSILRTVAGVETLLAGPTTVAGLAHTGQEITFAAQIEGRTIHTKAWASTNPEPYNWTTSVSDNGATAILAPGAVGVRSGVAFGNTNPSPRVFSYGPLVVRYVRASVEMSEIKPKFSTTHADKTAAITGQGILRRLKQGTAPVKSTLRRALELDSTVVSYWPMEDGKDATEFASAITGQPSMTITPLFGTAKLAAFSDFPSSAPLPFSKGSIYQGHVPAYPIGNVQLRFLVHVPDGGLTGTPNLATLETNDGLGFRWAVQTSSTGSLLVEVTSSTGAVVYTSGASAFAINGKRLLINLALVKNGANVDWTLATLAVNAATGNSVTGTAAAMPLGQAVEVYSGGLDETVQGHITVHSSITSIFAQKPQFDAYNGERAGNRFIRLCAENAIPSSYLGNLGTTAPMGPQRIAKVLDLLQDCADAELSTLYEPRSVVGLAFRTLQATCAVDQVLTLDYAGKQVAPVLDPRSDDQNTRNDITTKTLDGSKYRITKTTGPLNSNDPWADPTAAGRYDAEINVNVGLTQLPDTTNLLLTRGTTDVNRFPQVTVDLRAPQVAGLEDDILSMNMDDRMQIQNMVAADQYDDADQLARGYTEVLDTAFSHRITFNTAPYAPYNMGRFDSARYGRFDTATSTTSATMTTTATSVTVVGTTLWTTSAPAFPFDIMMDGERMTVTTITGATSPQTFTVVRSVNDVVKAHASGAVVRLADPVRYGR